MRLLPLDRDEIYDIDVTFLNAAKKGGLVILHVLYHRTDEFAAGLATGKTKFLGLFDKFVESLYSAYGACNDTSRTVLDFISCGRNCNLGLYCANVFGDATYYSKW